MRLPFLYKREKHLYFCGILSFWFALFYGVPNHLSPFKATPVPETWFDQLVPFQPMMVWIYMSTYVFMFIIYFVLKNEQNLNRLIYSFASCVFFGGVIFFFVPTEIPRHGFPLPDDLDWLTRFGFESLRTIDNPTNAVPSLHVALSVLGSFIMLDESRWKGILSSIWGAAIIYSTMAVKQHHLIDVVTGTLLGCAVFWAFHRRAEYGIELEELRNRLPKLWIQ